jgi:predicted nicotinamide N-methyase
MTPELIAAAANALMATAPWRPPPLLPDLPMPHSDDELTVWSAMEAATNTQLGAPFAAMVWPGSQVIARAVLDGTIDVAGRDVWDIGAGSGAVAIAAAKRGARRVTAIDIDPIACAVARISARRHQVDMEVHCGDAFVANPAQTNALWLVADAIHCADVARQANQVLRAWSRLGEVIIADGGRPFCKPLMLELGATPLTTTNVPVAMTIEGCSHRTVVLWRLGHRVG